MSKKNLDRKGRFRGKTIAFRVSPEENELLERKVKLAGMTKQDYIIQCVLDKEIVVKSNPYVYRSLHDEIKHFIEVYNQVINDDELDMIEHVFNIIKALREENANTVE